MRAVGFYEYGPAHVLQVLDLPELNAGQDDVRVKVHAAATVSYTHLRAHET